MTSIITSTGTIIAVEGSKVWATYGGDIVTGQIGEIVETPNGPAYIHTSGRITYGPEVLRAIATLIDGSTARDDDD